MDGGALHLGLGFLDLLKLVRPHGTPINRQRHTLALGAQRANVSTGGNPSAEEAEEALENGAEQVNNVVHSFRLQSTQFDKKVCNMIFP
jgi:hypothetical protein